MDVHTGYLSARVSVRIRYQIRQQGSPIFRQPYVLLETKLHEISEKHSFANITIEKIGWVPAPEHHDNGLRLRGSQSHEKVLREFNKIASQFSLNGVDTLFDEIDLNTEHKLHAHIYAKLRNSKAYFDEHMHTYILHLAFKRSLQRINRCGVIHTPAKRDISRPYTAKALDGTFQEKPTELLEKSTRVYVSAGKLSVVSRVAQRLDSMRFKPVDSTTQRPSIRHLYVYKVSSKTISCTQIVDVKGRKQVLPHVEHFHKLIGFSICAFFPRLEYFPKEVLSNHHHIIVVDSMTSVFKLNRCFAAALI
ncbi:hypothetical protein CLF_100340 [Clonorchis sinensis]|uniref:Uncharacterized protein n=1 Tax=Clonorchis sinensis TaxID=79923 RepID=G7Y386_CLOSI|nr:hypothetical protein CLF_100340 [Clonorchis sinensis]